MASWIVPGFGTTGVEGIWVSPLLLEESSFFAFEVTAEASDDLLSLAMASALQPSLATKLSIVTKSWE